MLALAGEDMLRVLAGVAHAGRYARNGYHQGLLFGGVGLPAHTLEQLRLQQVKGVRIDVA